MRFYTYQLAMGYVMEEAAKHKIAVVILDRPNPINGWQIEGPLSREPGAGESPNTFIAYLPMPIRHGMTMGELARLYNDERKINANLTVIAMENWQRDYWYDETGLSWINPSPNMRNMNQATLYPGVGAIEYSNVSVGRGTDQPFEQLGAPWINGPQLADRLNARRLPGHPLLSDHLHAEVEQVRERRMPGRVHGDHESGDAAAGARRDRNRGRLVSTLRSEVRAEQHVAVDWLRADRRAHSAGRRSRVDYRAMDRGRSTLAPAAREISVVSLTGNRELSYRAD